MLAAKRNNVRPGRRKPASQLPATSVLRRGDWIVRWIGTAKRRAAKLADRPAVEAPSARIIQLSWADTFGRPVCTAPTGTVVRLPL
ncbi:hypothetical protein [Methylobacterium sp. P1-11]|uniref:hypothetical protein n=1 Tax=Methylobacterium sp. P1-11 TaxID=2024616 RepID=UPI0011F040D5|nr:hypothetical protein [Methylobacterium sp. P1-11]